MSQACLQAYLASISKVFKHLRKQHSSQMCCSICTRACTQTQSQCRQGTCEELSSEVSEILASNALHQPGRRVWASRSGGVSPGVSRCSVSLWVWQTRGFSVSEGPQSEGGHWSQPTAPLKSSKDSFWTAVYRLAREWPLLMSVPAWPHLGSALSLKV